MESTISQPFAATSTPKTAPAARTHDLPRAQLWTGWVLSGFAVLFLAGDTIFKLVASPEALKGTAELGWSPNTVFTIGVIELVCLVAYLIPRTAVLGAVLFTGCLGGAIATHLRIDNPLFTHVLFPVYVAAFIWGGLFLRDRALRAVLPFRKPA
jgi:DoxX-like protein